MYIWLAFFLHSLKDCRDKFQLLSLFFTVYTVSNGTCFTQRLPNGNCVDVIPKITSKKECCDRGGFFLNRLLTQTEYLRDQLIYARGSPNCVEACKEFVSFNSFVRLNTAYQATCDGYSCPEGHTCQVLHRQPTCLCRPNCELSDYQSGPICTANLEQFSNRCELKRAQCESRTSGSEEIPCSNRPQRCAPKRISDHLPPPSTDLLISEPNSARWWITWPSVFLSRKRDTFRMERFARQHRGARLSDVNDDGAELSDQPSDELSCPAGEYCMLRQLDGLAKCVMWSGISTSPSVSCGFGTSLSGPFCAVDNRTYADGCELRLAGIHNQLELRVAYQGECRADATCENVQCTRDGMTCRPHHLTGQPVCLDCSHLPDDCNPSIWPRDSKSESREQPNWNWSEGDPVWNTSTNTKGWPTVCGSNRRVYANTCFLHVINCMSRRFVSLQQPSYCVGKFSTGVQTIHPIA
ncbi:hypothetical protein P879_01814 [Paragonimus westermani]|uniref:Follistatin n=1 Tax=Paragonimus westermani TaxID=34504 RepID=A0A8T0DZ49_9TREM|nr:hypothetical protein P879_01814 [Paragonimus westermani]